MNNNKDSNKPDSKHPATGKFEAWLESFLEEMVPLERSYGEAYWSAQISGSQETQDALEKAEKAYRTLFQNPTGFSFLSGLQKGDPVDGALNQRQVVLLGHEFEENQMDDASLARLVKLQVEIESEFNNFRAELDGSRVSDNELCDILRESKSSARVRSAWEASKQIGARVSDRILELVRLRNDLARRLGYRNHQEFSLKLSELEPTELFSLLDDLERVTREPFRAIKSCLDEALADRFGVRPDKLAAWHYGDPFFQSAPATGQSNLDDAYRDKDLVSLTVDFYDGIGLDIRDILERSDLHEREGKCQHAFCMDLDRAGDVRVLCNLKSNEKWMGTLLHELGHAVYDKYFLPEQPHVLRGPTHIFFTEAIAMLFGRLSQNERFLCEIAGIDASEANRMAREARELLRRNQIIFIRWGLVMVHFEKALYENPDRDLDTLWWELVERFQLITRPPGRDSSRDWATKIHIASSPVYYQNYILGELTASQLQAHILERVLGEDRLDAGALIHSPATGEFLKEKVFRPGRSLAWNALIREATGESLTPKYFIEEFASER